MEMIGDVEDMRMWRTWRCRGYRDVEDTRTKLNKDMGTFGDIWGHFGTFGDVLGTFGEVSGRFGRFWGGLGTIGGVLEKIRDVEDAEV